MAWFFISRVTATLAALVTLLVLTRLLPAEDFARYNIAVFAGMVAQKLAFAWIVVSITRFNSAPEFDGRTVALGIGSTGMTAVLVLPVLVAANLLVPVRLQEAYLLASAFALALAIHEIALACLRVQKRGPVFSLIAIGRPVMGTSLAVTLLLGGADYRAAVVAVAAGAFVFGCLGIAMAAGRSGIERPDRFALSKFLAFGQPLAMVMAGSMGFVLCSQLILAWLVDLKHAGFFAAAAVLSERSIAMVMMTLGQVTAASIFQAKEEKTVEELAETLSDHFAFLLLFSTPLVMALVVANETCSVLLFGSEMGRGIAAYLPYLAVASMLNGLQSSFFSFTFTMQKRTALQLALTLSLLAVHALVSVAAVQAFGPLGAAASMMTSAASMVAVFAWIGRDVFALCSLWPAVVQMAMAAAAALPFLAVADRAETTSVGVGLITCGMVAMLIVLKLSRYRSIELIVATIVRPRREE